MPRTCLAWDTVVGLRTDAETLAKQLQELGVRLIVAHDGGGEGEGGGGKQDRAMGDSKIIFGRQHVSLPFPRSR